MQEFLGILVYIILGAIIFMSGYMLGNIKGIDVNEGFEEWLKGYNDGTRERDCMYNRSVRQLLEHNKKCIDDYHELLMEYAKVVKGDK